MKEGLTNAERIAILEALDEQQKLATKANIKSSLQRIDQGLARLQRIIEDMQLRVDAIEKLTQAKETQDEPPADLS